MRYLLSIHDVWPGNFSLVEDHWQRLQALGMGPAALMVVPEYHGGTSVHGDGKFLDWLTEKRSAGSEIFLHGFRHCMPERVEGSRLSGRRSAWGRWVNRRLVNGEAEFLGLPRRDREELLAQGMLGFQRARLPLEGFVAPTWHGAPPKEALVAKGFRYWETRFRLHNLALRKSRFVPPLAWEKADGGPLLSGGKTWLKSALRFPLVKVAIHPGDLEGNTVLEILGQVAAAGNFSTYREVWD